jgi:hypothetical protein
VQTAQARLTRPLRPGGRYVHSELIHSRFAMAGVAGILIPDILTHVGLLNVPVWYNQGLIAQQGSFAPFSAPRPPWPGRQPMCGLVA